MALKVGTVNLIESISIPAGCTIYGSDYDCFFSAFEGCYNLKTIIFPAGTVYLSGTGIFTHCDNLESVVIPKGFVPVYISKSDFKDYNLLNYIQGDKIKKNFKFEDSLRNTKVRNAAVVYHEAYLDAYNKAFSSKDYDKAMQTAKEFKEKNSDIRSSAWSDRYNDAVEKPYLGEYNKVFASKDYAKAMELAKDFREKYSNVRSSDWRTRYTDAVEKTYLESYNKAMAAKDWEKAKSVVDEECVKVFL